ncbi:MAG TPA: hypothetical protein VK608_10730 [Edaphobacter sp.]|nr:hypothetical protein [Edaphobacter sp.]
MTIGYGGVFVESSGPINEVVSIANNKIAGLDPASLPFIGLTNTNPSVFQILEMGSGFIPNGNDSSTMDTFNGLRITEGPGQLSSTFTPDTTKQGIISSWNNRGRGEADIIDVRGGGVGGVCFYNVATGASIGSPISCFNADGSLTTPAISSGIAGNSDLNGVLSFSSSTTASYAFTDITRPHNCTVTPAFDPGSGNRYWITTFGNTSFTLNFATPVTGNVTYICTSST